MLFTQNEDAFASLFKHCTSFWHMLKEAKFKIYQQSIDVNNTFFKSHRDICFFPFHIFFILNWTQKLLWSTEKIPDFISKFWKILYENKLILRMRRLQSDTNKWIRIAPVKLLRKKWFSKLLFFLWFLIFFLFRSN